MIKKKYKDYTITIEKQKPSVKKPETEEEWDKHFETHGGETKGTHKYKVEDSEGIIINEDNTEMWDTEACLDNAMSRYRGRNKSEN
jgi:ATP-dependent protease HslVU (ClpYQ) ATPase subunit